MPRHFELVDDSPDWQPMPFVRACLEPLEERAQRELKLPPGERLFTSDDSLRRDIQDVVKDMKRTHVDGLPSCPHVYGEP